MTPEGRAKKVVDGMDDGGRLEQEKVAAIAAAIRAAVAEERERCAKVADAAAKAWDEGHSGHSPDMWNGGAAAAAEEIAKEIRKGD